MEKTADSANPLTNDSPARLVGYANPLELSPSFVLPVFDQSGLRVLQIIGDDQKIIGFCTYDPGGTRLDQTGAKKVVRPPWRCRPSRLCF